MPPPKAASSESSEPSSGLAHGATLATMVDDAGPGWASSPQRRLSLPALASAVPSAAGATDHDAGGALG